MHCSSFVDCVNSLKPVAEFATLVATFVAVLWAACAYHRSVKLERARWIKQLYEKFYEQPQLKRVRDLLDSGNVQSISQLIKNEDPLFTDYLNFFEFLAYLSESKQIKKKEMEGLFGYYLRSLRLNREVVKYINDAGKGFEKLQRLLRKGAVA